MRFWRWLWDENPAVTLLKLVGLATIAFFVVAILLSLWIGLFGTG